MYTAQICHHMYRKGSKCKSFTKSLNFGRTTREKKKKKKNHCPWLQTLHYQGYTLEPLAPSMKAYTAHPLIILRPKKQLGKVPMTQGFVIAPSHPHVCAAQHGTCT